MASEVHRRMNVLALSYLFPNQKQPNHGIFIYNRLKAVSRYHNVEVVAPVPWFPFRHYFSNYEDLRDVPSHEELGCLDVYRPRFFVVPHYLKWIDSISYMLCSFLTVLKLNYKIKFDIVDVHWAYPDMLAGYVFSRLLRKPLIVTLRGKEAICYGERSIRKKIIDCMLRKADRVVCLSKELAEIAFSIGVHPEKTEIISNGVDVGTFMYTDQHACRQHLKLPYDKKIILSVGFLIERKGFHKIILQLPELLKVHPALQLYIIGSSGPEGDFHRTLSDMITELSLQEHVFLVGQRSNEELVLWYNAADVFCLPTRGEGSPNVVLEALSCGCPVIASSVGGIPDIMSEEFLGYTFDVYDKNALRDVITAFFCRTWDRKKIRKYMEGFSWDWCARKVLGVYQDASWKEVQ